MPRVRPTQRRLLLLAASIVALMVVSALLYDVGMSRLEGTPRDFWTSLEWAAETLTTTGYGKDAAWRHPAMVLFVIAMQFVGVFLVFLIVPIVLLPFLEERFEARLPRAAAKVGGHVVIYRYGPAVETLLDQLEQKGVPYALIEEDESVARTLLERNRSVVYAPPGTDPLAGAALGQARALVANSTDEENAAILLSARQEGFGGEVLAIAEDPFHRAPLALAGATAVFTPRHILAAALAARASDRISPRIAGVQQLGRKLQIGEVRVHADSPLAGRTLRESRIGERTGVTVIGQWVGGRLQSAPTADMRLEPRGIVVAVGSEESLERLENFAEGARRLPRSGAFVIAGLGEVGGKVRELLTDAGELVVGLDRQERPGATFVGNVLDRALLLQTELQKARALILALDTDDATLFATVIAKDMAPEVPVIARVSHPRNVERMYRAGADFALSLAHVSGQLLARRLLGEEAVTIDVALKVLKTSSAGLVGRHPAEMSIREQTGCSVVAVERGEELLVEFAPEFRFAKDDQVYICGSDASVRRFQARLESGEGAGPAVS
jgi:Trk K+ transport system NAD-binding subunit